MTILGFLDLSAAFDCVDHLILLQRLQHSFGVDSIALQWITSYFRGRSCRVRYNGVLSELSVVDSGVPQGSVLGPKFFLLYTSDVFALAEQHGFFIHGYADDLQIYQHCFPQDMIPLGLRLTKCVENIESWISSNRLRLNVTKTEFLWLGSPIRLASNPPSSIQITGSSIAPSKTVRSLGVLIDPAISFREQITGLANTCYYHLRQLRSIRRSLSFDSSHALVRALIFSRLDYCNGLLSGALTALLDQMNGVMRASARFILQKSRNSHITVEMNSRLHWLDIRARIDFKLCVTTFRCLNELAPRYLARHCTQVSSIAGRAHLRSAASGMLVVPSCSTKTIGPRAFAVSGSSS